MQQGRFGEAGLGRSGKVTRREQFLDRMEQVVPWARFEQLIVVHYPVAGRGRRPYGAKLPSFAKGASGATK